MTLIINRKKSLAFDRRKRGQEPIEEKNIRIKPNFFFTALNSK